MKESGSKLALWAVATASRLKKGRRDIFMALVWVEK
jgi:hypothetical protein